MEWSVTATGEMCSVRGRVIPSSGPDKTPRSFESKRPTARGNQEFGGSGTYTISLEHSCPADSMATVQVRVYDWLTPGGVGTCATFTSEALENRVVRSKRMP